MVKRHWKQGYLVETMWFWMCSATILYILCILYIHWLYLWFWVPIVYMVLCGYCICSAGYRWCYVHVGYAVLCTYCTMHMMDMWCCMDMVLCKCCICSAMYICCCVNVVHVVLSTYGDVFMWSCAFSLLRFVCTWFEVCLCLVYGHTTSFVVSYYYWFSWFPCCLFLVLYFYV